MTPRPDLVARSVVLHFRQLNNDSGFSWIKRTTQKYGPNGADSASDPDGGLRVVVQTVDLEGYSRSDVSVSLVAQGVANTRAWWKRYIPELESTALRGFAVGTMSVVDASTGAAVSLVDYPNVLEDGQVAEWMQSGGTALKAKQLLVTAVASYDQYDAAASGDPESSTNGNLVGRVATRQLSAKVTLTDGSSGSYSTVSSYTEPEAIPTGLAQSIYEALAVLQYEGVITLVEDEVTGGIGPANVVNLTGGAAAWATMRGQVQQVERDYGRGRTTVTIGPARHLSAADLTQLFLVNRYRRVWTDPRTQATGKSAGAGSVVLGSQVPHENAKGGEQQRSVAAVVAAVTGGTCLARNDAENKRVMLDVVDSGGTRVASSGAVEISLGDLAVTGVPTDKRIAKFREFSVCVGDPPTIMKVMILATETYPAA